MKLQRTVTTAKIEANRMNSKRSTGPRTEGGKRNSRFNALTLGLFAKHVVIPICDGYKAEKDFQLLLDGLHQEFEPVGFYEEWLVAKVAESMWRLRRATRCESGSVREAAAPWEKHRPWEDRQEKPLSVPGRHPRIPHPVLHDPEQLPVRQTWRVGSKLRHVGIEAGAVIAPAIGIAVAARTSVPKLAEKEPAENPVRRDCLGMDAGCGRGRAGRDVCEEADFGAATGAGSDRAARGFRFRVCHLRSADGIAGWATDRVCRIEE